MIYPPFYLIASKFRITTPPRVTLTAVGGEPNDLISTKCSFFNFYTSAKVSAKILLASATDAAASSASFYASAA